MDSNGILSLLGLALRGGNLAVGEEPAGDAAQAKDARLLLLASDAAVSTRRRIESMAREGECLWVRLPFTKAELGPALGRASAAIVAITDIGLAGAVAKRLTELDSAQYASVAERLELKAKRAAERKRLQSERKKQAAAEKRKAEPAKADKGKETAPKDPSARPGAPRRNAGAAKKPGSRTSGNSGGRRSKPSENRFAHSRPVKKGKGSFRKKEG